jgi:hypothetical protein
VDRAVNPVHGSTVDRSEGYALIRFEPPMRDPTVQNLRVQGVAVNTPVGLGRVAATRRRCP